MVLLKAIMIHARYGVGERIKVTTGAILMVFSGKLA
jgi:hypothetical protein